MRKMFLWIAAASAFAAIAVVVVTWIAYLTDMREAHERISGKSAVVATPYGDVEYTEGGIGPDVLVIHGAGGGYDQGELMVEAVLSDRFHWIAPSRFGYLRSTFREGASYDDQAHAYDSLLDELGVSRVAVVGLSAGGPSALLFALLYPDRVSSLTLLSCGVAPRVTETQKEADKKGRALVGIFKRDASYWLLSKLFRKRLMTLMGVTETVIGDLDADQLSWCDRFIEYMNPASVRYEGAVFDNTRPLPGDRIAGIRAPTFIVHAEDDTLQLFDNAAFAATTIPHARLLRFENGGHFVIIIEQDTVREAVQRHIVENARELLPDSP
ncbi:MAG: alpha/beta hydrolase [Candidatus Coatesbacteria bacterium]|nr:MAG: alpha/beta hydrolase [Candidatus Coatesbacteria bacterium]